MLQTEYPFEGVRTLDSLFPATEPQDEKLEIGLQSSGETVDGRLLLTRAVFHVVRSGRATLSLPGIDEPLEVGVRSLSESEEKGLLYRAKLYRKLKYIERVFNVKFSLPPEISSEEVKRVEIVFRGITEGAFSTREPGATFRISPGDINQSEPPYLRPGQFNAALGEGIELLDRLLNVGPITIHIDKAALANPRIMDEIQNGSQEPVVARFEILDNQMGFCFEDYAKKSREALVEPLERFKEELALEEPEELVALVSAPLAKDVSSYEASQIAVGWTQYNDLPDRYCPQAPELDAAAGQWHVPIYLVHSNGEGGLVGEVVIDEKTGVIVSHTPVDELRSQGRALAEQILHA